MEIILNQKKTIPFTVIFDEDEPKELTIGQVIVAKEQDMILIDIPIVITDIVSVRLEGGKLKVTGFGIEQ